MIQVFKNVLKDPDGYREQALNQKFSDKTYGGQTFKGISEVDPEGNPIVMAASEVAIGDPVLSFFRKSPLGQKEPNYIHSDIDMGEFSAVYYMNPEPPPGDGTTFWEIDGRRSGEWDDEVKKSLDRATPWTQIPGEYNSMVVFRSDLFHSRSLVENYGHGDSSRLIQVVFLS